MEGEPEGTGAAGVRPPRWMIPLIVIFAIYLGFRLVEAVMWLAGRL
jgi:hypothetical protein